MPAAFVAYPGSPPEIGRELEITKRILADIHGLHEIQTWVENEICGRFLVDPILEHIRDSEFLVADVTKLNFNVIFEIGFAVGVGRRLLTIRNSALSGDESLYAELGILDTLGLTPYQSADHLAQLLAAKFTDSAPITVTPKHPSGRPRIFLVDALHKDYYDIALTSAVKKSKVSFERYDPQEKGRLPGRYAIESVHHTDAFVARLLPASRTDSRIHNLRVAFCAGIAQGLDKEFLILQDTDFPVPLDYRDLVQWAPAPPDISPKIAELALALWDKHQQHSGAAPAAASTSLISRVDFGSPIAENESLQLNDYP